MVCHHVTFCDVVFRCHDHFEPWGANIKIFVNRSVSWSDRVFFFFLTTLNLSTRLMPLSPVVTLPPTFKLLKSTIITKFLNLTKTGDELKLNLNELSLSVDILKQLVQYNSMKNNSAIGPTSDQQNIVKVASNLLEEENTKTWLPLQEVIFRSWEKFEFLFLCYISLSSAVFSSFMIETER